jgi:hypothetical protein
MVAPESFVNSSSSEQLQDHGGEALWNRLPSHIEATTRLDATLLGLISMGRQQVRKTGQIDELSEPIFPSVASLLNPDLESSKQPISNGIGNHGKIKMQIPRVEKLATMYAMCNLVRVGFSSFSICTSKIGF